MTREQMLLVIAAEECFEVAQRLTKAVRFGLEEVQPDQGLTNAERVRREFSDLAAVLEMLDIGGPLRWDMDTKKAKVEKYLAYSLQCGQLRGETA